MFHDFVNSPLYAPAIDFFLGSILFTRAKIDARHFRMAGKTLILVLPLVVLTDLLTRNPASGNSVVIFLDGIALSLTVVALIRKERITFEKVI